jgi:hypothetical protein
LGSSWWGSVVRSAMFQARPQSKIRTFVTNG